MSRAVVDGNPEISYLFNAVPMPVAVVSGEGIVVAANQALGEFLGYTTTELVGKHFSEVTVGGDVPRDMEQFDRLVAGEISQYTMHKHYRPRIGLPRPARLTVITTPWGEGELLMLSFVLPIDAFEAAGVTEKEREEVLEHAVGQWVVRRWRIWLPILALVLGANVEDVMSLIKSLTGALS